MKELADWLIKMERLARDFYDTAAQAFKDDKELAGFLKHLAEDEAWHYDVMGSAAQYLEGNKEIAAGIVLDRITREKVEVPFRDCGKKLGSGTLTREHVINCMVAAEFSEWNNVFVYVVNTLKEAKSEFAHAASKMQAHKRHIENFIESLPEGRVYLKTLRRLPPVWNARILIVHDDAGVLEFLSAVLSTESAVETAVNGKEGLDKVREKLFDVVISDLDMPVMNGIEFYHAASLRDTHIRERFLFLTGDPTDTDVAFFTEHRVKYLTKPVHINEIKKAVGDILDELPIRT